MRSPASPLSPLYEIRDRNDKARDMDEEGNKEREEHVNEGRVYTEDLLRKNESIKGDFIITPVDIKIFPRQVPAIQDGLRKALSTPAWLRGQDEGAGRRDHMSRPCALQGNGRSRETCANLQSLHTDNG